MIILLQAINALAAQHQQAVLHDVRLDERQGCAGLICENVHREVELRRAEGGVAEVDAAIRRLIESHRPYPAFQPALARDIDVIEIRRTWYFNDAVRLQ